MKKKEKISKTPADTRCKSVSTRDTAIKYLIGILSLTCVIALVYRPKINVQPILSTGDIANTEIRAVVDFSYVDQRATESLKEQSASKVQPLYYLEPGIKEDAVSKIDSLFNAIKEGGDATLVKQKCDWLDDDITIKHLLKSNNPEQVKENTLKVCTDILDRGIITTSTNIRVISGGKDIISLRDPVQQSLKEISIEKFIVQDELDAVLDGKLKIMHPFDRPMRQSMKSVLSRVMRPNIIYDSQEVMRQKDSARESVSAVHKSIRRGQTLIRQGDPFTETHKIIFEAQAKQISKSLPREKQWWNSAGTALLVFILYFILVTYLQYHQPEIFSCNKRLLLLAVIVVSTLLFARLLLYAPAGVYKLGWQAFWQYFIIIPISAMLIALLMDKELAIIVSMIMSIIVTVLMERHLPYSVIILFGCITAIQSTTGVLHRWEFIKAGISIGIAQVLAIVMVSILNLYSPEYFSWKTTGFYALGGMLSGLACALLVIIFLPLLEQMFNITTDIRLLELSDLNHPLLKMMITEAPGTYHHSIVVSNMAESAADAIGANSLLAKVGGYYHDIGKVTKPEYFVENAWFEEKSKHDKLFPTMSNLVITAHVKDGMQLAKKYRLPSIVADIIAEHHGTSLVYYFFKQAEKISEKEGNEISEEDFRYPGPKPRSKESGIILMADAVEAASKTLIKPTPNKIEELVKEILNDKINDGQLDECGLTLKELSIIRDKFTHILTGILHKRVEYPE